MTYKLVDTFNGYESGNFKSIEAAQKALDKAHREHARHPGTRGQHFCKSIAPSNATYDWNARANYYEWSELTRPSFDDDEAA